MTQLLLDVMRDPKQLSVHFGGKDEFESILNDLSAKNIAIFEIDGAKIGSQDDLFRSFAVALRKPKGWYGDEEYATNGDAFLEYLQDVSDWVPAKGHLVVIRAAETFWRSQPGLAGRLVELWQFATGAQGTDIHLLFVWSELDTER